MKNIGYIIKEGFLDDAITIAQHIPEFKNPYPKSEYTARLRDVRHLILTAYKNDKPIGFKIGYETASKKYFYSWLGGVLVQYRQFGIAEQLTRYQEDWINNSSYNSILVKTRQKHKAMIQLLQKHGFTELGILPYSPDEETRILYEKKLNSL